MDSQPDPPAKIFKMTIPPVLTFTLLGDNIRDTTMVSFFVGVNKYTIINDKFLWLKKVYI